MICIVYAVNDEDSIEGVSSYVVALTVFASLPCRMAYHIFMLVIQHKKRPLLS